MLLADELVLVAIDLDSGRHRLGTRDQLNACLAGLLVIELVLDGHAEAAASERELAIVGDRPVHPVLAAAAEVLAEKDGRIKGALSHMDRGLRDRLGTGTWDTLAAALVDDGSLEAVEGGLRDKWIVHDPAARDRIIATLRQAADGDEPMEVRTAALLSMTGPAQLLEVVAPDRAGRKHARRRIDHALDGASLQPISASVRRVLAEAAAVAAATAVAASAAAATSGSS
ncbi:MAG: GOLPH3/VPS74 family protein [Ilumatobacteraceae bacterium]